MQGIHNMLYWEYATETQSINDPISEQIIRSDQQQEDIWLI